MRDKDFQFSVAQSVAATAVSTNHVDLQSVAPNIGVNQGMYIHILITTTIAGAGSDTVTVDVETDADTGFSGALTHMSIALLEDVTVAGQEFRLGLPVDTINDMERFVRLNYTDSGGITAGAISAWLDTN